MPFKCTVYGLGLQINVPIKALAGLAKPERVDVCVEVTALSALRSAPSGPLPEEFYTSRDIDKQGIPEFRAFRWHPRGNVRIAYSDGFVFDLDERGQNVTVYSPPSSVIDDLVPCLMGPILGVILRLRGIACLHASAVVLDGRAIGLVGESGAGKSTTAAAFARLGNPVLTDDVSALTDRFDHFLVRPAYPRIRLWPESVAGLFGSADSLPRMMAGWDKRFLSLQRDGYRFQSEALPLAALYFLAPRGIGVLSPPVEAMNPTEALMLLISDSFATNFQDKPRRAAEFELLSRLVQTVPLRRISATDDLAKINDLCSAIAQDFRLQCATAEAL